MKLKKILCLFTMVLLTGCNLAESDGEIDANENKLIGVMITDKPMDSIFINADIKKNDKLEYIIEFKNIHGYDLFNYCFPETQVCKMISSEEKSGLINTDIHEINVENKKIQQFSTTLYYTNTLKQKEFYENPIYQKKDGTLFAASGSGTELPDDSIVDISSRLEQTYTIDDKEYETEITVNIKYINNPDYFNMIEMNDNHQEIKTTTFKNNEISNGFKPDMNTSFIIFEQISLDNENNIVKERKVINKKENVIEIFKCKDEGICFIQQMNIEW